MTCRERQHEVRNGPDHFCTAGIRRGFRIAARSQHRDQSMEEPELGMARHHLPVSPLPDRSAVGDDQRPGHVDRTHARFVVDLRQQHDRHYRLCGPGYHRVDGGFVVGDRGFRSVRAERRICDEFDAQRRSLCRASGVQDVDHLRPSRHPLFRGRRVRTGSFRVDEPARDTRHHPAVRGS